ncbi:hypothetical protein B0H16DRAFT_1738649 [Mycena metata]|uniref:Uncharacterized protein n=1 Tax=Mycena metata TaxID=1033252 RepID=A0AAD7MKQ5_9AGAR|nr:hypothetical protein B0H16DRAFT_1738649 [Mycena metata]
MGRSRTPLVQTAAAASPSRITRQTRAKAAKMDPKVKVEDQEEGLGDSGEGSSSRNTRQTRAKGNAAKVKREAGWAEGSPSPSAWKVRKLKGDAPPCEVPASFAVDHEAEVLFFNTYDEAAEHGSEIYACDMKTQTWTNITLPSRYGGSMAFYKSKTSGQRILFIFGGQVNGLDEDNPGEISSELITIDIDALKWWVVDVAGGAVAPRISSALVVVDDEIFIFGGRTYAGGELERTRSFSICSLKAGRWTWDVRDEPHMALGQCWDAVVVQEGNAPKILLPVSLDLYDRDDVKMAIELRPHNFLLFDIGSRTFEADFDDDNDGISCQWYSIFPVPASLTDPSLTSAVICTFQAKPQSPELYLYYLHPDRVDGEMCKRVLEADELDALESFLTPDAPLPNVRSLFEHFDSECKSFGIRKRIRALKKNFEFFTVVGSKAYFLGWTNTKWDIFTEI